LLAVQQSAEHTTFELQSGENSCTGSENAGTKCIGCSHLAGGEKGVVQQHIVMPTPAIQYRNIGPNQTAQNRNSSSSNGAVRVGDTVALEAPASLLLTLSSVIYLAPVILMLFFAVSCGFLYPDSEAAVAVSAVIGLSVGLGVIVLIEPALRLLITKKLLLSSNL